jgi:hypothetical protein
MISKIFYISWNVSLYAKFLAGTSRLSKPSDSVQAHRSSSHPNNLPKDIINIVISSTAKSLKRFPCLRFFNQVLWFYIFAFPSVFAVDLCSTHHAAWFSHLEVLYEERNCEVHYTSLPASLSTLIFRIIWILWRICSKQELLRRRDSRC